MCIRDSIWVDVTGAGVGIGTGIGDGEGVHVVHNEWVGKPLTSTKDVEPVTDGFSQQVKLYSTTAGNEPPETILNTCVLVPLHSVYSL